jgi:glycosyltransferase involved in cell wall biosynthesis
VARLVGALARLAPLRLVTTIQGDHARSMGLSTALRCGQEIPIDGGDVPEADGDLGRWARLLLRRRRYRHDPARAARSSCLYTLLRPPHRHFRRELGILYDFTPMILPWAHVPDTLTHFGAFFTRTAREFDKMVAISKSTKADAAWLSSAAEEDVVVGYPGPSLCVRAHAHPDPVGRGTKAVLVVATLEPRKNGLFLLDWFLNTDVLDPDMELWWVGPSGWMSVDAAMVSRGRSPQSGGRPARAVRFLGMVPDAKLCELYRRAAFAIYPSLYEGFGFPVLDALRHGTPVVSSYHSSLQEFAGPGVFYFDPCDKDSLDAACRELQAARAVGPIAIDHDELQRRYTWEGLARAVLSLARD